MPAVKLAAGRLLPVLAAAVLLALASACGGGGGGGGGGGDDAGSPGSVTPELVGVISDLQRSGGRITGFTLRTDAGETHQVLLDPAIDYGLTNETYEEHVRAKNRLRVGVERRQGKTYATLILNA